MNNPHKHADLIKAWADGVAIQIKSGDDWIDIHNPSWQEESEYRPHPDTFEDRLPSPYPKLYEMALEDIKKAEMNLRDQIAVALIPIIHSELREDSFFKEIARVCYALADEMLIYRGE
jgi:hypothetical protein